MDDKVISAIYNFLWHEPGMGWHVAEFTTSQALWRLNSSSTECDTDSTKEIECPAKICYYAKNRVHSFYPGSPYASLKPYTRTSTQHTCIVRNPSLRNKLVSWVSILWEVFLAAACGCPTLKKKHISCCIIFYIRPSTCVLSQDDS